MTGTRIEIHEIKHIDIGPVEEHMKPPNDIVKITLTDFAGTHHVIIVSSSYGTTFRIRNSLRKS